MGRAAEVTTTATSAAATATTTTTQGAAKDDDDMDTDDGKGGGDDGNVGCVRSTTTPTGTRYGLTLTAVSVSMHQRRSVVLWSLLDAMPADAWMLVPRPPTARDGGGVLVWGCNTVVYVGMGGKIGCALAANGFARIGCPPGLIPPPGDGRGRPPSAAHLEPNPSPLPRLALQLDAGSRVSFVTDDVALVCLGNGTLHSLELHDRRATTTKATASGGRGDMFMSLFPLGHRVGGLGSVVSCLSVFNADAACHSKIVSRYLGEVVEEEDNDGRRIADRLSAVVKEDPTPDNDDVVSTYYKERTSYRGGLPKILSRGLVFVGSRMGDCSLLAFSLNEPTRLVLTDAVDNDGGAMKRKRKTEETAWPDAWSSMSSGAAGNGISEPMMKQPRCDNGQAVEILDEDENDDDADVVDHSCDNNSTTLTEDEVLRLEEEELYRVDDEIVDGTAPSIISSCCEEGDAFDDEDRYDDAVSYSDADGAPKTPHRRRHRSTRNLSMFGSIRALDSLTGLGPLGGGCYGPVATCPSLTGGDDAMGAASSSASEAQLEGSMIFSNAFSSAARHYVMPCGFGESGGLAVLTTPGRDNVGGSILCESDLCNMAGSIFSLPRSNLILMGKADGIGSIALRGVLRPEQGSGEINVEQFEEVDIGPSLSMEEDGGAHPNFSNAVDVLGQMTMLAAAEFCSSSYSFSVFFVRTPRLECDNPYAVVVMSNSDNSKDSTSDLKLMVDFIHRIDIDDSNDSFFDNNNRRGHLSSITPMVSKVSNDGSIISSVAFGCAWTSGNASVFNIALSGQVAEKDKHTPNFKVSESIFVGDCDDDVSFYDSNRIVALDVISLPSQIFDSPNSLADSDEALAVTSSSVSTIPDPSSSLSFPPDRLSMHGTWSAKLDSLQMPTLSHNRIVVAICRRSGLLQIFDNEDVLASPRVECQSESSCASPIWQANGCGHGTAILGQGVTIRRPEHHEVEVAEIRCFVAGPSLQPESISGNMSIIDEEKDSWMLRSLCVLVDTSQGDLHLYSGSKRSSNLNRLEFSRVPLFNVTRPSEEAARHLIKLRRKGIAPQQSAQANFRASRLHRFCNISGEDGLFAATPRPLWFVSERGAPTVVSHKSRHVSPAGGRPVPVSGFCTQMPAVFRNASNGFITVHERIGRIGSQRLTLYNGLWDVFAPHGLIPGGGISIQKVPLGVTVRHIEVIFMHLRFNSCDKFIDDASISTPSRPVYAMLVSHEIEGDQRDLNDDGLSPEERQRAKDEKEAAMVRKQVEADLGGFDMEQEWVEEIEREDCFTIDQGLGLAPPMPTRKYELWLADASSQWNILDRYQLDEFEHGTALKVMFLTDVVEDSEDVPEVNLFIGVGTSAIDHDGEDLASKGRLLLFQVRKSKKRVPSKGNKSSQLQLKLKSEKEMALGPVTSLSSLKSEDKYRMVVGAGAEVTVEQWGNGKLTQVGFYHAHMQIQEILLFKTFFLLSDAYDSLHFLVWRESDKSLTLLAKDYEPNQVFAAGLISRGGAMTFVCHDDRQNLSFLQYAPTDAAARGGNKLVSRADFHMGTQTTTLKSHWCQSSLLFNSCTTNSTLAALKQQDTLFGRLEDDQRFAIHFGTTDGSLCSIVPLSEPTYWRLTALQSVMSNALEANCALSHMAWRLYRRSTRRAGCRTNDRMKGVIDGDIVMKFVDLSLPDQEALASSIGSTVGLVMDNLLELGCAAAVI
ncbi:hypothetical protein ACHAW5_010006 [Stephanodiscus triporus]|uniref:RSE1/DDB1/CPSF1 C-terminal domain-containing protein n=1 Tax=Stephanodiscus triporus TaxID=2934178 RepID=A0ABD3NIU7_9STRA